MPTEETIAMLNLDMVGRARGGVDISGLETAPSLEGDLQRAIEAAGKLNIRRQGPGAGRSDECVVHREASSSDQLFHRFPQRLSSPHRRLGRRLTPRGFSGLLRWRLNLPRGLRHARDAPISGAAVSDIGRGG